MSGELPRYEWGCVHGRFQPFHGGHLEYVLRAAQRCRRLVVGITNPDPTWVRPEPSSDHRHAAGSNPFTYVERALMVEGSLLDEGFEPRDFVVVPFPIQVPELCRFYVPEGAVHFVRVYSAWEKEKVRRLQAQGLPVEVLDRDGEKGISGSEVRGLVRSGLEWEHLVPRASARVIRDVLAKNPRRLHGARGTGSDPPDGHRRP